MPNSQLFFKQHWSLSKSIIIQHVQSTVQLKPWNDTMQFSSLFVQYLQFLTF